VLLFEAMKIYDRFHIARYTTEGCATFFKNTRFKRLDKAIFDYDKLSAQAAVVLDEIHRRWFLSGWWFQIFFLYFFVFTPIWGNDPF